MLSATNTRIYATVPGALSLSTNDLKNLLLEVKNSNVNFVRIALPWATIQPTKPTFVWTDADRVINAAFDIGLNVLIVLAPPKPSWSLTVNPIDFANFASAVAARYRQGGAGISVPGQNFVSEYQIWDEPNANWPVRVDPALYAAVLKSAYTAIKRVGMSLTVITGGLQSCRTTGTTAQDPNTYINSLYRARIKGFYDVIGFHPLSLPTAQFPNPFAPSLNSIEHSDLVNLVVQRNDPGKKMYWTSVGYDPTKVSIDQHAAYLDRLRWFAQRRNYVTGMSVHWRTSNFVPARTQITKWNDNVYRHTIFTIGESGDGWGFYNDPGTSTARTNLLASLNKVLTAGGLPNLSALPSNGTYITNPPGISPDATVGRLVNYDLYNWVPISYPGSSTGPFFNTAWNPANMTLAQSIQIGVNELTESIRNTPGTFAIVATGQGAIVASQVLRSLLPGGSLNIRQNDCIGSVVFGNPCRRAGSGYVGGTSSPLNSGILSLPSSSNPVLSGLANVNIPSWWSEMTMAGDFFAAAPMIATDPSSAAVDNGFAATVNQMSQVIYRTKGIALNDPAAVSTAIADSIIRLNNRTATPILTRRGAVTINAIGLWLREQGFLKGLSANNIVPIVIKLLLGGSAQNGLYPHTNPHNQYSVAKPPSLPPGLNRHKLFTFSGTAMGDSFKLGFQAMVADSVRKDIWEWVPVFYPHWIPVNTSVEKGIANGIAAINAWPGKFGLSGYSQGAIVCSALLWEMKFGVLQHRYNDLVGAVMYGNPCREANTTFPGGINPGGSGIAPDSGTKIGRVRNTPSSIWWEFANSPAIPGVLATDNFTVCPLDSRGNDISLVYQMVLGEWNGSASYDLPAKIRALLGSDTRAQAIQNTIQSLVFTIQGTFFGHAEYLWARPLPGSNLNSVQLGINHLNAVGAAAPLTQAVESNSTYVDLARIHLDRRAMEVVPR